MEPTQASHGRRAGRCFFFWDYDTQWGADRSRSAGGPKNWGSLEFSGTERLLELHARYGVAACFAVVGSAALAGERPYHDPEQIRRIHAAGHEIASHSHVHDWLPGLGPTALRETLRTSRDALEQCIGARVISFVPPFNQPFDYAAGWSFSLAERRTAGPARTDLQRLCEALGETGYEFCRVAYKSLTERLRSFVRRGRLVEPSGIKRIAGVTCLRLTLGGGFGEAAVRLLNHCASQGGLAVFYGHPHSVTSGNTQDQRWLEPFLGKISEAVRNGLVEVCQPRDLLAKDREGGGHGNAILQPTLPGMA